VQRERLTELIATAGDAQRARKYLLESSMIEGLRRANDIA
jgi:hypothetical protein